ncbi:MAG: hypothetical protein IPL46_19685 [Saprospiraceae bacterium]|nr:hypothetical protein [Saprospiraceae bacterium]
MNYFNEKWVNFGIQSRFQRGKGFIRVLMADIVGDVDIDIIAEDKYAQDARPWYYENLRKKIE